MVTSDRAKTVTVVLCVSASGECLPPLFIYARKKIQPKSIEVPRELLQPRAGLLVQLVLEQGFKWFIVRVQPTAESSVLLILDGHSSYTLENNVTILCLLLHCTPRLQPLDVSVMKPLSMRYTHIVNKKIDYLLTQRLIEEHIARMACEELWRQLQHL